MPARVGKRRPGVLNPPGTKSVYCFYTLQRGYSHPCDTCSGGALDRDTGTPYTVEFNRKQCCPKCYNLAVYQMSFNLAMVCRCEACEPLNDFLEGLPTGARMAGEAMPIPEQRSTTTTADKHMDKQEKETQLLKETQGEGVTQSEGALFQGFLMGLPSPDPGNGGKLPPQQKTH